MGYSRTNEKKHRDSLVIDDLREQDSFPREVEMLMHEHSSVDILPGHLDVWLEEADKKYFIEGRTCHPL